MADQTKDVTEGLRMMANEFSQNAERSMSVPQQFALSGRAMIAEGGANEITRLRSENASLREDISRYVSRDTERLAEVEKLREALKPFDAMGFFVNEDPDDRVVSMGRWVHGGKVNDEPFEVFYADLQLTVADIRRARAVLTGTEAPPAAESPSDATSTTKDT